MFEDDELSSYMQITLGDRPFFDKSTLDLWVAAKHAEGGCRREGKKGAGPGRREN